MSTKTIGNDYIEIDLELGTERDPIEHQGIAISAIRDMQSQSRHNYLTDPTPLFEFSIIDESPIISNNEYTRHEGHDAKRLVVRHITEFVPGERIGIEATALSLTFYLEIKAAESAPVVEIGLRITKNGGQPDFLRMVFPKIHYIRTKGTPEKAMGMVSMEIGSVVPLRPLYDSNTIHLDCESYQDEEDRKKCEDEKGKEITGTMGMPYRKEAKRIGLPTSMNTMELASIYDPDGGGGVFFADIDGDVENGIAPIQFTLSYQEVAGFWISELRPGDPVEVPRLAIGVHPDGDWHRAVDYYVAQHKHRWCFPEQPAWFEDQAAIYTFDGGGAGGIYLERWPRKELPKGAIWTGFEVNNERWWGPVPLTQAGLAPPGASIAATVRREKDVDVFVVGDDGAIYWTYERDNGPWQKEAQRIPATEKGFAAPGGHIAAVARNDEHLDLFVVRQDGAVWTVYKAPNKEWDADRLTQTGLAPSGAKVAATARGGKDVDVFVVGDDGAIYWTYERNNGGWPKEAKRIPATDKGSAAPGGAIAAIARNDNHIDLFVAGLRGAVWTAYNSKGDDLRSWEYVPVTEKYLVPWGANIAVIKRHDRDVDIFVVGNERKVLWTYDHRDGVPWPEPEPISEKGFAFPGASISAVARNDVQTDVFVVRKEGFIDSLYRVGNDPWKRLDSDKKIGIGGFVPAEGAITALRRHENHVEVFAVAEGRIRTFRELPELLKEAQQLGTNILYLWDYWDRPLEDLPDKNLRPPTAPIFAPYWNKGDYWPRADLGGEKALIEGIKRVHDCGGRVILYFEPFIIWEDSYVARFQPNKKLPPQGEYLSGRFPITSPLSVISSVEDKGTIWRNCYYDYNYVMLPGLPAWKKHVIAVVKRLVHKYGADGIFLDSYGWQMNWPMWVAYLGPGGLFEKQYWPLDYSRDVLRLADEIRRAIGPDKVVLAETPAGPMGRHCHGGVSMDLADTHRTESFSNQDRITASPVRYGIPQIRYFGNGKTPKKDNPPNQLYQIFAAGHGLALCGADLPHTQIIKQLVDIRKEYKDALIHGRQLYQPDTGNDKVAAYYYQGRANRIMTIVNTDTAAYEGAIRLRDQHANSAWQDLLSGKDIFQAKGNRLEIPLAGRGLRVLRQLPWYAERIPFVKVWLKILRALEGLGTAKDLSSGDRTGLARFFARIFGR